ncbi:3-demethylubiquinone-9 3-methyltransferase [Platysternon megacephalum]|uniref:3-demethylubiquinone-9 3-methyltransferase n=1 Tax=Platysternon megacephalum TaxID=55544 RepID=A0A4D9DJY7_9SAUR|nr:3-demethylubiquinone-9 3-methyltransferase [Platysternon megacephalum]
MTYVIQARDLVQVFSTKQGRKKADVRAVDGVSLDVTPGEIVGFLGPNGAGKTTTLRMLTTLLKPTSGTATVAGFDVVRQSVDVRRNIGYVSQAGGAFSGALAGDEVVDHGLLYGMRRQDAIARGKELFAQLDLDGLWKRMPKQMSGGQKRRLDIAMGLINDPKIVFLDEPTTGLDPQARANLWEHIRRLRDELGATIILTTHYLDEADALSDRIVIIDKGKIVASDTPAHLKAAIAGDLVDLVVADTDVAATSELLARFAEQVAADGVHVRGRIAHAGASIPNLLRELDQRGLLLEAIEVHRPTLDDVFLTMTGRSLREAEAANDTTEVPA